MNMIVMMDETGCIGINGNQPVHLNEDLKRFRDVTIGNTIVCGRKTLETFPDKLPLQGRSTIVISGTLNQLEYAGLHDRSGIVVRDPFTVVKLLKNMDPAKVIVVGGASIYEQLLPWTTRVFVTQVHTVFIREFKRTKILDTQSNFDNLKYFPIDILDNEFEIVGSTNIDDYDRLTNKKYKTTVTEYVRY